MNQILSVEMPQQKNRKISNGNKKSSIKSVSTFFSIILIIFGISLIGIGVFSMFNGGTTTEESRVNNNTESQILNDKPRIDIVQNGENVEIEIFGFRNT